MSEYEAYDGYLYDPTWRTPKGPSEKVPPKFVRPATQAAVDACPRCAEMKAQGLKITEQGYRITHAEEHTERKD